MSIVYFNPDILILNFHISITAKSGFPEDTDKYDILIINSLMESYLNK
jgi:hypothetical protein